MRAAEFTLSLARLRLTCTRVNPSECQQFRQLAEVGRTLDRNCPNLTHVGKTWPNCAKFGQYGPPSANFRQTRSVSVQSGPTTTVLIGAKRPANCPNSPDVRPIRPDWVNFGVTSVRFGPDAAEVGHRPRAHAWQMCGVHGQHVSCTCAAPSRNELQNQTRRNSFSFEEANLQSTNEHTLTPKKSSIFQDMNLRK